MATNQGGVIDQVDMRGIEAPKVARANDYSPLQDDGDTDDVIDDERVLDETN